jgi:hypothetical protein
MSLLTSSQALQMAADFALAADHIRTANDSNCPGMAKLYDTACRVAFLRAHALASAEETHPALGDCFRRASFAVV